MNQIKFQENMWIMIVVLIRIYFESRNFYGQFYEWNLNKSCAQLISIVIIDDLNHVVSQ